MKPEQKHPYKRDMRGGDVMQVLEKEVGFSPAQMDQYKKTERPALG